MKRLLLASLLTASCAFRIEEIESLDTESMSYEDPVKLMWGITVAEECPNKWLRATEYGARLWNDELDEEVFVMNESGVWDVVVECPDSCPDRPGAKAITRMYSGYSWVHGDTQIRVCMDNVPGMQFHPYFVMVHELGHSLSMGHIPDSLTMRDGGDKSGVKPTSIDPIALGWAKFVLYRTVPEELIDNRDNPGVLPDL